MLKPEQFRTSPSGEIVRAPLASVGNLLVVQPDGTIGDIAPSLAVSFVVTGLAGIKAVHGTIGQVIHETSRGFSWKAFPYGDATANDVDVINATDSSVTWKLIEGTADSAKWLAITDWYISDAGSVWGTGTDVSHPVPPDEIQRRWGSDKPVLAVSANVHYSTNLDHLSLSWKRNSPTDCLSLIGSTTVLITATLASYAAPLGNEDTLITATGISDWTAYEDKRLNFGTCWSRVIKANPNGAGVNVARITVPIYQDGNPQHSYSLPTPGLTTFTVESIPEIQRLSVSFRGTLELGTSPNLLRPLFYGRTFRVTKWTVINDQNFDTLSFRLYDCDTSECHALSPASAAIGGIHYLASVPTQMNVTDGCYKALPGSSATAVQTRSASFEQGPSDVIFQGISLGVYAPAYRPGTMSFHDTTSGYGLMVQNHCEVTLQGSLRGSNVSGVGVQMRANAAMNYATLPAITGLTADWQINGGSAAGTFSWATTPKRRFAGESGVATLVPTLPNSIAHVSVPNLPADAIVKCGRRTTGGTTGDVEPANQTISGFDIISKSSADSSVCWWDWYSPGAGNGGIFLR
jgi:hypothetical protein